MAVTIANNTLFVSLVLCFMFFGGYNLYVWFFLVLYSVDAFFVVVVWLNWQRKTQAAKANAGDGPNWGWRVYVCACAFSLLLFWIFQCYGCVSWHTTSKIGCLGGFAIPTTSMLQCLMHLEQTRSQWVRWAVIKKTKKQTKKNKYYVWIFSQRFCFLFFPDDFSTIMMSYLPLCICITQRAVFKVWKGVNFFVVPALKASQLAFWLFFFFFFG